MQTRTTTANWTKLLLQARRGDRQAANQLFTEMTPWLCQKARTYFSDDSDAHDLAQDTLVRILDNLGSFDETRGKSVAAWAAGICRNRAIDIARHRAHARPAGTDPDALPGTQNPMRTVEEHDDHERLRDAVSHLPQSLQQPLKMRYLQHMKYEAIALALRLPLGTVAHRIHRAINLLRTRMGR